MAQDVFIMRHLSLMYSSHTTCGAQCCQCRCEYAHHHQCLGQGRRAHSEYSESPLSPRSQGLRFRQLQRWRASLLYHCGQSRFSNFTSLSTALTFIDMIVINFKDLNKNHVLKTYSFFRIVRPDAYVAIAEKLSRKIFSSMSQLLVHYRPFCIYDAKIWFFFELCKDFSIFFQKKSLRLCTYALMHFWH